MLNIHTRRFRTRWSTSWHKRVGEVIVKRVQAAKLFSISADETTDKAHAVNLAIGVRYIHNGVAEERVLSIVDLAKRDGDFVSRVVLNQLETWGLSFNDLLSQTHDGASVMSGRKKECRPISPQPWGEKSPTSTAWLTSSTLWLLMR